MQVFSDQFQVYKLERYVYGICILLLLNAYFIFNWLGCSTIGKIMASFVTVCTPFFLSRYYYLSDDVKSGLVSCQTQHDKVSISSIDTMVLVRIIGRRCPLLPDKLHYFMLSLSTTARIRKHHSEITPKTMISQSLLNIASNCLSNII
jgi:hypothetical protein